MAPKKAVTVREYFKKVFKGPEKVVHSRCIVNKDNKINENKGKAYGYGIETDDRDLQCGTLLSGEKVSNMKHHLKSIHPNVFKKFLTRVSVKHEEIIEVEKPNLKQSTLDDSSSQQTVKIGKKKDIQVPKISNYGTLKQVRTSIPVSRSMLIRALLAKVTVDGRPFSALNDISFQTFAKPTMKSLNMHYDSKNISELVTKAAEYIKQKLKIDIEGSLVSVKVDCATRNKKSFIGINVQLVKNGKITVYTLSVKEVTVRHTGENLKKIILQELEMYGILPKNIYTITSDNGANIVKSVNLIQNENNINTIDRIAIDDFNEEDDEDCLINGEIMEKLSNVNWNSDYPMSIRCAAHTLQLCVHDTLKKSWEIEDEVDPDGEVARLIDSYSNVIAKARKVVVELRTQNVGILLREQNLKSPPLDVQTRWSSTYLMLSGLLPLKDFCSSCVRHGNVKLMLTEDEWKLIKEIRLSLEPCYLATKKLQSKSITLTDIYKIWNVCHMSTSEIGSAFSNELVGNMINRRDILMENVVMLSAIYLDPRFSFELTADQKEKAVKHICRVQARLIELEQEREQQLLSSDTDVFSEDQDDEDSKYERQLHTKHRLQKEETISKPSFKSTLLSFANQKRIPLKTDILQYWKEQQAYKDLLKVAQVILGVPGTQVTVEQLFSQLKFIYSDLRTRLKSENTNNILIVRCNFDLLDDFIASF